MRHPFGMRSIPKMYLPSVGSSVKVEGRTITQSRPLCLTSRSIRLMSSYISLNSRGLMILPKKTPRAGSGSTALEERHTRRPTPCLFIAAITFLVPSEKRVVGLRPPPPATPHRYTRDYSVLSFQDPV